MTNEQLADTVLLTHVAAILAKGGISLRVNVDSSGEYACHIIAPSDSFYCAADTLARAIVKTAECFKGNHGQPREKRALSRAINLLWALEFSKLSP